MDQIGRVVSITGTVVFVGQRPNASLGSIANVSELELARPQRARFSSCQPSCLTMCGICGQYNFASQRPVEPEVIRRMATSIVHRGPDDEGFYFDGSLGLGFRRLSIIDLAGGHQPMCDREESVWVVFNGEIYNFPELKR